MTNQDASRAADLSEAEYHASLDDSDTVLSVLQDIRDELCRIRETLVHPLRRGLVGAWLFDESSPRWASTERGREMDFGNDE